MRPLFHVVSNVWGDSHVDLFLDLTLPNVLSPGNLPALPQTAPSQKVVCVKFSKLPALVMAGVGGAAPPYSAASATPGRRQAAMALSASFLRSLRCSMLR
jgi:hypothetical protein